MPKASKFQKPKVLSPSALSPKADKGKVGGAGRAGRAGTPKVPTSAPSPVREFGRGRSRTEDSSRSILKPAGGGYQ